MKKLMLLLFVLVGMAASTVHGRLGRYSLKDYGRYAKQKLERAAAKAVLVPSGAVLGAGIGALESVTRPWEMPGNVYGAARTGGERGSRAADRLVDAIEGAPRSGDVRLGGR